MSAVAERGAPTRAITELRRVISVDRRVIAATVLAVIAAACTVVVPAVLAAMTNIVFAGVVGARFEAGTSRAAVVATLRAQGDDALANVVDVAGVVPGRGIDWPALWTLTAWAGGLFLVVSVARAGSALLLNTVVQSAIRRLRARIEGKLHRLPVADFTGSRTADSAGSLSTRGGILTTITADVDNLAGVIGPLFVQLPVIVLTIVGVAIALFLVSPFFALLILGIVPISAILVTVITRRAQPHIVRQWTMTSALTSHVEDALTSRDTIAANDAGPLVDRDFDAVNADLAHASRTGQSFAGSISPVLIFCNALGFVAIAVLGAMQMLEGAITLGALQAVVIYAQEFSSPLGEIGGLISRLQSGFVSLGRVRTFLARPEEPSAAVDDAPIRVLGRHTAPPEITFSDVHFSYGDGDPVLAGVDFTVRPGSTTALVGATGSGKTTLTSLLLRLHDPDSGRILIDGVDIADESRSQVRSAMAVVTQEPWLFTGTAGENIAYGSWRADTAEDLPFVRVPVVGDIVANLPAGLATSVSSDAETLSAGERQLVTVARALAARPRILILDEATSAADPRSELLLQRALQMLRSRTTTIVVTHRMSTLAAADDVVVLSGGRIVERGPADELLVADGEFNRLFGGHAGPATR